jgi:S-adenosylmethionine decarboxylase
LPMIVDTAPHVSNVSKYINHEISTDLDSTDAFEGPEKLLEVWFASDGDCLPRGMYANGLRAVPRHKWEEVLDHVQCKVLSVVSTSQMDAYVLSESSLFVFPHKVILKTCGTTTLLVGVTPLLDVVADYAGYSRNQQPWRVFYSRKSFMFPDRQKHPHKSWKDEVACLDSHFDHGSAYVVGNIKRDHWYLYTTDPQHRDLHFEDETLEIMMTDLSPVHASQFFTERIPGRYLEDVASDESSLSSLGAPADDDDPGHDLGNIVTKISGVDQIYPTLKQTIDSFCFAPCGYSCNGVVNQGNYFTIHVTPENHCSYASFETNVPATMFGMTNDDVVEKVINIFRPGKFTVTLFESREDTDTCCLPGKLDGYRRSDRILYQLGDYNLLFVTFEALRLLKTRG